MSSGADSRPGEPLRLRVLDAGRMAYSAALDLQLRLVEAREQEQIDDTLILVEHPPVITMGRSAEDGHILADPDQLAAAGVEIHRITRGGEATYHGPGQVVGYAIVNLYNHQRRIRLFVQRLEETIIRLLADRYQITAERDPEHRGVWIGPEKIAAIGISVQRKITMHGFALNVNTDLSHFAWIIPCGIRDRGVTSISAQLGRRVEMAQVKKQVADSFAEVFGYRITETIRGLSGVRRLPER